MLAQRLRLALNLLGDKVGRRGIVIASGVAALLVVGATLGLVALFPPERIDVTVASPNQSQVSRPGVWTFRVRNVGPSIGDFGVQLGGGDGWLQQHTIVTASSGCQQSQNDLLCGALAAGESETISITATPNAAGAYSYSASSCDCAAGHTTSLLGPNGARFAMPGSQADRYTDTWTEQVLPEPSVAVTVTDLNGNALSGATISVEGSAVSSSTASTGVARLGLGPLTTGIYTVVATHPGIPITRFRDTSSSGTATATIGADPISPSPLEEISSRITGQTFRWGPAQLARALSSAVRSRTQASRLLLAPASTVRTHGEQRP